MTEAASPPASRVLPRRALAFAACVLVLFGAGRLTGTEGVRAQPRQPRLVVFEALNSPT